MHNSSANLDVILNNKKRLTFMLQLATILSTAWQSPRATFYI